eukprot:CAMPEP_0117425082 /NCGR_PEP_ID=MMETSP0758-20121206/5396_1 /TAXON_ID=63605 /ORGANISM="Percolomonas cosmopolitus, Strain AE-1 (ATCC 50343)" /LENGTH=255 /DNA_ID=CAMNT_0005209295 /DNA_START=41 /DNA_END=808 /DNA_ORIENTATION=+
MASMHLICHDHDHLHRILNYDKTFMKKLLHYGKRLLKKAYTPASPDQIEPPKIEANDDIEEQKTESLSQKVSVKLEVITNKGLRLIQNFLNQLITWMNRFIEIYDDRHLDLRAIVEAQDLLSKEFKPEEEKKENVQQPSTTTTETKETTYYEEDDPSQLPIIDYQSKEYAQDILPDVIDSENVAEERPSIDRFEAVDTIKTSEEIQDTEQVDDKKQELKTDDDLETQTEIETKIGGGDIFDIDIELDGVPHVEGV